MSQTLPSDFCGAVVDSGRFVAGELFERKFGGPPPLEGHHVVLLHKSSPGAIRLVSYAHFSPFGDTILVGGVCTDGDALRQMPSASADALIAAGGAYYSLLRYGFARFADQCQAYFGYCGDARAEVVNLQAGFVKTEHAHLLVNFHRPVHEVMQRALIAKIHSIGAF
jgi:hypothetical protein